MGCLTASTVVAAGATLASGNVPSLRQVIGVGFVGIGLATASMIAPDLAGSMAVLILTSTVFLYGGPLFDAVSNVTGASTTGAPSTSTTQNQKGLLA